MLKSLMASALMLSLLLTSVSATPARADGQDIAKVLGGLVVLYAIGRAIDDRNDNRQVQRQVQRHATVNPGRGVGVRAQKVIPNQCFVEVVSQGQIESGYGARCMQNNVRRAGELPPRCLRQVDTRRGTRNLYSERCLRRDGWVRG